MVSVGVGAGVGVKSLHISPKQREGNDLDI